MPMNNIVAQIKSLLIGNSDEIPEDEPKRNPYPNGPVTYKTMTNGQVRRMQARARRRTQDRAFREQRRNYMTREGERAVLRGMLQVLGFIAYVDHQKPSEARIKRAAAWCEDNYGGIENAVKRYEVISGEKVGA